MLEQDLNEIYELSQILNNVMVPTVLIDTVALPVRNCAVRLEKIYQKYFNMQKDALAKADNNAPVISDVEAGTAHE